MKRNRLTTIAISRENYVLMKNIGSTGESFNDVLTRMLKKEKPSQTDSVGVGHSVKESSAIATNAKTTLEESDPSIE
jgi:predicted CopG family antitoxin